MMMDMYEVSESENENKCFTHKKDWGLEGNRPDSYDQAKARDHEKMLEVKDSTHNTMETGITFRQPL